MLGSLLAHDNYVPHLFALRADRQVHRYGVLVLAGASALLFVGETGSPTMPRPHHPAAASGSWC